MSLKWFPEVSKNFINNFSGTKKFVDAVNGSNSNNGNTEAAAYQTLPYAQSETSGIGTAVMYVINPGTYNLTAISAPGPQGTGSAAFYRQQLT